MIRPSWDELALREAEATRRKEARGLAAMHLRHGWTTNQRCGDCAFLVLNPMETAVRYYKCAKYGLSSSAATDWRLKYAACGLFEPQQTQTGETTGGGNVREQPTIERSWLPAIGDRVRVRLSPECRHKRIDLDTGKVEALGHFVEENGAIGTVVAWPVSAPPANGHDIAVDFDEVLYVQTLSGHRDFMIGGAYFAGELDLIETAAEEFVVAERTCRVCGCTDRDCSGCVERTGQPCYWIAADLCSACSPATR